MVDLKEFGFIELHWYQPSNWKKSYILKFDEEEIATLEYPSIWSTKAVGTTAHGNWSFKTSGIFRKELTIRVKNSKTDFLKVSSNFNNNQTQLNLPSGNVYTWKSISMMTGEYGWYYQDEVIFDFKFVFSLDRSRIKTTFTKSNLPNEDLSILLLLGTYFLFAIQQNSGS